MILLYNGKIFSSLRNSTALAVRDGVIVAAGSDIEVLNLENPGCEKINLDGKSVLPSLTDSHIHFELFSLSLSLVNCQTKLREDSIKNVAVEAQKSSDGRWIVGYGWNQNTWGGVFGTCTELDQISNGHPIFLSDKSLHSAWVNSAALTLAGINDKTPDPEGGSIQRDFQRKPTGILFEKAVMLVQKLIPSGTETDRKNAMLKGQAELHRLGITGIHDFDRSSCFTTLQLLHQNKELTLRVAKSIPIDDLDQAIQIGLRTGFGDDMLFIGPVKMFADGALGPQTAAMLSPYENKPSDRGTLLLSADQVFESGMRTSSHGLSLAIHAIGDRATHDVLNGYAMLREFEKQHNLPHLLHRVEHLQLLHPDNLNKASSLGIVASMQPIHIATDMFTADKHWGERSKYAYAFSSLLSHNTQLIFGSDAPVESPNPFWGISTAVSRRRQDGEPDKKGWYSQERIMFDQALHAYSSAPARVVGKSKLLGRLEPGYLADLMILGQDPTQLQPDELYDLLPESVMVEGNWVYHF
ncbi:MAG: amidohydrolase [Chloroflexi bacterium]|nr:amidohydrolase [Chloroflexota bacterium]